MLRFIVMFDDKTQEYLYCRKALYYLNAGKAIDEQLAYDATLEALMIRDVPVRHYFLSAIFHGMLVAGPTTKAIVGMLEASFSLDAYHPTSRPTLDSSDALPSITIMGSGKKGLKTVNISTLAAITASSSKRLVVIKPCTAAISSLTGSADFVDVLGIDAHKSKDKMRRIALDVGLGLFFVNSYMTRFMESYDDVFYAPHAMSYALAGLVAPYSTDALLYGLALPMNDIPLEIFRHYRVSNPTVVSSSVDGLHFVDEALLPGKTTVGTLAKGVPSLTTYEFGKIIPDGAVTIDSFSPVKTKSKKDNVIKGLQAIMPAPISPLGKTIALNAGVIMHAGGIVKDISEGYRLACQLIESGAAWSQLHEFTTAAGGSVALLKTLENGDR